MFDLTKRPDNPIQTVGRATQSPAYSPSLLTGNKTLRPGPTLERSALLNQPQTQPTTTVRQSPLPRVDTNPTIGENLFLVNQWPIRQNDNPIIKGLKGLGNFGLSVLSTPDEVARQLAIQFGSVASGQGIAQTPKNTSFIGDILPQGASSKLQQFQQSHPVIGGLGNMLVETAGNPLGFISGKTAVNAVMPKSGFEQAAKMLSKTDYFPGLNFKNSAIKDIPGPYTFRPGQQGATTLKDAQGYVSGLGDIKPKVEASPFDNTNILDLLKKADVESEFSVKPKEISGPFKIRPKNTVGTPEAIEEIQSQLDNMVNDIAVSMKQADQSSAIQSLASKIREKGGISPSKTGDLKGEYSESIPVYLRNKNGLPLDQLANEMGMTSNDLLTEIGKLSNKVPKDYLTEAYRYAEMDPEYRALNQTLKVLQEEEPVKKVKLSDIRGQGPIANAATNNVPTLKITSKDEFLPRQLEKMQPIEAEAYRGKSSADSGYSGVGRYGEGKYYSNNPAVAKIFAKYRGEGASVEKANIKLEKPFVDYELDKTTNEYRNLTELLEKEGFDQKQIGRILGGSYATPFDAMARAFSKADNATMWPGSNKASELIRKAGYDGIIGETVDSPDLPNHVEFVKFDELIPEAKPIPNLKPSLKPRESTLKVPNIPKQELPQYNIPDLLAAHHPGVARPEGRKFSISPVQAKELAQLQEDAASLVGNVKKPTKVPLAETAELQIPIEKLEQPKPLKKTYKTASAKIEQPNVIESLNEKAMTKIPDAPAHPVAEKLIGKLDDIEAAAWARIKESKGRLNALPVDVWADYGVIGAVKIAKGSIKFSVWSADMVKDFGDEIKPHLQDIWEESKKRHAEMVKGTFASQSEGNIKPKTKPVLESPIPGDATTFRSKIDRNPAKKKEFSEIIRDSRTQFVEDVAPLERLEKDVTGKIASAEDSIYKQARLFRGSPERAHEIIQSKLVPVIKDVESKGYSYKDLGDYALAVHARDVNAKGIISGFNDNEIKDVITKFGTPEMEAARQQLMKLNNDVLKELADSGVIEQELVKVLREKHPNYMPLFRSFNDDKVEFANGFSKALANVTSPIKKLKGSERNVIDPMESMIKNVFQAVNSVDRNKVALQLSKLADTDTEGLFIRRLAEGENRGRLNAVYAREGGKQVYYEVQPDVYKAIMSLDKESSNFLIKVLQKPASLLRAGATLTPEFSFRNPIRDIAQAFIVSKSGLNPLVDVPSAIMDIAKSKLGKETMFNDFLRNNGGYGNIISADRKVHQETLKNVLIQPTSKKFVNVLTGKSLINVLRSVADFSESTTKLAEYKAAIRQGQTGAEAAYRAKDLMDFGRAGVSIREANKVVAFLNANIQGKSKLIRAIKENPVGVTTRAVTTITLPSIGVSLAQKYLANNEQKKIINNAPTWLRDTFWLIPIPGTNQVARIPKPFDLAPIFANLPERLIDYVYNKDSKAFDGFAKATLSEYSIPTMLTGLMPFVEGMANYSFFKQGSIIPQRENSLNYPDQYDINTSEIAKLSGKGINAVTGGEGMFKNFGSPRVIDNTIRGITGGLGSYATSAIDFIAEKTGLVDEKQRPAHNPSELPFFKAFLAPEKTGGKAMDDLYKEKDRLTREKGSAGTSGKPFKYEERLKEINSVTSEISKISKEMRQIENNKRISPQSKKIQLNRLSDKRNVLAREVMKKSK